MKQMIRIIRKVDLEKQNNEFLELELDYELTTLYNAMQNGDETQKKKSKERLSEIHEELGLGL